MRYTYYFSKFKVKYKQQQLLRDTLPSKCQLDKSTVFLSLLSRTTLFCTTGETGALYSFLPSGILLFMFRITSVQEVLQSFLRLLILSHLCLSLLVFFCGRLLGKHVAWFRYVSTSSKELVFFTNCFIIHSFTRSFQSYTKIMI